MLGQFSRGDGKAWDGVPSMDDHPFFAPQTRVVLKNCGIIDPTSIEEYIAHGGYQTLVKTLQTNTSGRCMPDRRGKRAQGARRRRFPYRQKMDPGHTRKQADQKYLICNADEGDPGAFMDQGGH